MVKKCETDIPVTASSGNVFSNMGFPEPEEELIKAQLALHIRDIIKFQRLTQAAVGLDHPKVSALLKGRLTNFSSRRLMRLLTARGQGRGNHGTTEGEAPRAGPQPGLVEA